MCEQSPEPWEYATSQDSNRDVEAQNLIKRGWLSMLECWPGSAGPGAYLGHYSSLPSWLMSILTEAADLA